MAKLTIAPFPHELNWEGTDCATDCPACLWSNSHSHSNISVNHSGRSEHPILNGLLDLLPASLRRLLGPFRSLCWGH